MPSLSQKIKARTFPADFCTQNFLGQGGVSCYAATPLIVALSLGHSDKTRFHPWSPTATGNHLDHKEKIPKLPRQMAPLMFWIHVQEFWQNLCRELPYIHIFTIDGPNLLI
jgi:hypothetical protein